MCSFEGRPSTYRRPAIPAPDTRVNAISVTLQMLATVPTLSSLEDAPEVGTGKGAVTVWVTVTVAGA